VKEQTNLTGQNPMKHALAKTSWNIYHLRFYDTLCVNNYSCQLRECDSEAGWSVVVCRVERSLDSCVLWKLCRDDWYGSRL